MLQKQSLLHSLKLCHSQIILGIIYTPIASLPTTHLYPHATQLRIPLLPLHQYLPNQQDPRQPSHVGNVHRSPIRCAVPLGEQPQPAPHLIRPQSEYQHPAHPVDQVPQGPSRHALVVHGRSQHRPGSRIVLVVRVKLPRRSQKPIRRLKTNRQEQQQSDDVMHLLQVSFPPVSHSVHGGEGYAHGEEGHGEGRDVGDDVDVDPVGGNEVAEEGAGDGEGDEEAEDRGSHEAVRYPGGSAAGGVVVVVVGGGGVDARGGDGRCSGRFSGFSFRLFDQLFHPVANVGLLRRGAIRRDIAIAPLRFLRFPPRLRVRIPLDVAIELRPSATGAEAHGVTAAAVIGFARSELAFGRVARIDETRRRNFIFAEAAFGRAAFVFFGIAILALVLPLLPLPKDRTAGGIICSGGDLDSSGRDGGDDDNDASAGAATRDRRK
mmetsp:Transcript_9839/g.15597  ORF Transcript_9839/g.15597 Transcript_9839/m.15597 type:complete len:434 (+) Transcript_9839:257-1558(+)